MSNSLIIDRLLAKTRRTDLPNFQPGDTVRVHVKIKEGDKERLQAFEGVVISKSKGSQPSFTVRKMSLARVSSVSSRPTPKSSTRSKSIAFRARTPRQAVLPARAAGQGCPSARSRNQSRLVRRYGRCIRRVHARRVERCGGRFAFGRTNFRAVWVGLGLISMKIARHKKQNPAGECRVCSATQLTLPRPSICRYRSLQIELQLCSQLHNSNRHDNPKRKRRGVQGDADCRAVDHPVVFRVHDTSP